MCEGLDRITGKDLLVGIQVSLMIQDQLINHTVPMKKCFYDEIHDDAKTSLLTRYFAGLTQQILMHYRLLLLNRFLVLRDQSQ